MRNNIVKKVLYAILPVVFYVVGGFLLSLFINTISVSGGFEDLAYLFSGIIIGVPIFSALYGVIAYRAYRNIWMPAIINTITVAIPIFISLELTTSIIIPIVIVFAITLVASIITKLIMDRKATKQK